MTVVLLFIFLSVVTISSNSLLSKYELISSKLENNEETGEAIVKSMVRGISKSTPLKAYDFANCENNSFPFCVNCCNNILRHCTHSKECSGN